MSTPIDLLIKTSDVTLANIFAENGDYISRFAHPKELQISADVVAPKLAMTQVITNAEIYVPLAELINIEDEIKRLADEVKRLAGEVKRGQGKLNNERFVSNAPEAVVVSEREKLADWEQKLAATEARLNELKNA